jgi:hypothetical protein
MEFPGDIFQIFPNLTLDNSKPKSPATPEYNCIAWAANDAERFWWPDKFGVGYWPCTVPREVTLESFVLAYGTLGYAVCEDGDLEKGFEKIAIYANDNAPTHAARQLDNGKWTSKLGSGQDIEHDSLDILTGNIYGAVVQFLKRLRNDNTETK